MRDDATKDQKPAKAVKPEIDPVAMARRDLQKALPRRFWKDVAVAARESGFGIDLDGKPVRTPGKVQLVVGTAALAERIAQEWSAQTESIEPGSMPLTRLVNTAIDGVATTMDAIAAEVAKFAETDLVCYRAGDPETLVAAQAAAWDPILTFARDVLGARFVCAEGVMYVEQPENARAAVHAAVDGIGAGPAGALRLAALSLMTNLTGSVLIALAIAQGAMNAEAGWAAAHVDEDFQMRLWGSDADALARRGLRWRDMQAAADAYALAA